MGKLNLLRLRDLFWTSHAKNKMFYYRLSESRIKRVLNSPKRVEEGIAPDTLAMMQPVNVTRDKGQETWKNEIWVMVQDTKEKRKVISAWRYPGKTKPGSTVAFDFLKNEYSDFLVSEE